MCIPTCEIRFLSACQKSLSEAEKNLYFLLLQSHAKVILPAGPSHPD